MTTKPKPVTLFESAMLERREPGMKPGQCWELEGAHIDELTRGWQGCYFDAGVEIRTGFCKSAATAARALERKIESQWKRLGKLMGKEGKK
jgi:hypothetical protein